MVDMTHSAVGR